MDIPDNLHFGMVFADLTENCNLRCPFCTNNWNEPHGTTSMSHTNFLKLASIMHLASDESFSLSCGYEPLIHPHIASYLLELPAIGRDKAFLTSNMASVVDDTVLKAIAISNLHHINISVESLSPPVYEAMRVGASFERWNHNVQSLLRYITEHESPLKVRYIIMLTRRNGGTNLMSTLRTLHLGYMAERIEMRLPFPETLWHMDPVFVQESLHNRKSWEHQLHALSTTRLPPNTHIVAPYPSAPPAVDVKQGWPWSDIFIDAHGFIQRRRPGDETTLDELHDPVTYFEYKLKEWYVQEQG